MVKVPGRWGKLWEASGKSAGRLSVGSRKVEGGSGRDRREKKTIKMKRERDREKQKEMLTVCVCVRMCSGTCLCFAGNTGFRVLRMRV